MKSKEVVSNLSKAVVRILIKQENEKIKAYGRMVAKAGLEGNDKLADDYVARTLEANARIRELNTRLG